MRKRNFLNDLVQKHPPDLPPSNILAHSPTFQILAGLTRQRDKKARPKNLRPFPGCLTGMNLQTIELR